MTVTALCLTRNRRQWLPMAIECFQRQTYPHKRMLIVADTRQDVDGIVPVDPLIETIVTGKTMVVGAKRNFGCERIQSDLIAVWDDDDWSAPERLSKQVELLGNKAVAGYHSMLFSDGANWWKYFGTPNFALGASLMFRREWWQLHRFQEIQVGQDERLSMAAHATQDLVSVDAENIMVASIHNGNTSPRSVNTSGFRELVGFAGVQGCPVMMAA